MFIALAGPRDKKSVEKSNRMESDFFLKSLIGMTPEVNPTTICFLCFPMLNLGVCYIWKYVSTIK